MSDGWVELRTDAPALRTDAPALPAGVYELAWVDGETSVAAVGHKSSGANWYAPLNWITVENTFSDWGMVSRVRPLTPVPVAPALDPDLRALLLVALETGFTGALFDLLLERGADPDVTRAVRENAARVAESEAEECFARHARLEGEVGDLGSRALTRILGMQTMAHNIAAAIRSPTSASCGGAPDGPARDPRQHVCLLCGRYPVDDPARCPCLSARPR